MTERPILFSGSMIRALLAGTKTQTRREVKLHGKLADGADVVVHDGQVWKPARVDYEGYVDCPHGSPGDRLWVREAWRIGSWTEDGRFAIDYQADNHARREWLQLPVDDDIGRNRYWRYLDQCRKDCIRAHLPLVDGNWTWEPGKSPCRWRPSIHMPRAFSRIDLEITGVRVERLQEISDEDLCAEGIQEWIDRGIDHDGYPRDAFRSLWESINGPGSWALNPWVWVVEFRRIAA